MTIREATLADVAEVVEMGRQFRRESGYASTVPENVAQMTDTATNLITNLGSIIFVAEDAGGDLVGMIGLLSHVHFISGVKTCSEAFWFVEPVSRGTIGVRLLKRAEAWAREHGCAQMAMIQPYDVPEVGDLYQHLFYEPVEVGWQRCLNAENR